MDEFDGNQSQVRRVVEQVVSVISDRLPTKEALLDEVDKRIDEKMSLGFLKFRLWLFGAALMQIVPITIGAFYLGGIYYQNKDALGQISDTKNVLAGRGEWMDDRERWEQAVEAWAKPQGFEPPRERAPTR